MPTEIAAAYLALYAKMPGVQGDIAKQLGDVDTDKIGQDLGKRTGEGYTKGFALAGAVGGLVATVAASAASSIGDLVGDAVAASDATSKFAKTLDFAGVDSSTIDKLRKSTKTYADDTVYDLQTIQNTTAQLAANNVKDYDKLTEAAGNLNAVAGGNADTFKSVGMVLTQTAGAGKLTTENWNQLADAIPGASGQLQDALAQAGAYTGNFRDAMEKGEITADEFNAALMTLGTQPVAVEAAKSTETLEGATGSLSATIVGGLTEAINFMKPALTGLINGISSAVSGVFGAIGGVVAFVQGNLTWIGPLVAGIASATAVWLAWNGALLAWQTITKIGTALQLAFNAIMAANPIMLIVMAIAALVAGLVWFFTQTELGKQIWETFTTALATAWTWLWETILKPVFDAIGAIFTWLWNYIIMPIVQGIMIYIGLWAAIFTWLWETILAPVFAAIGAVFQWLWDNIIQPIVGYIQLSITAWGIIFDWLWTNAINPALQAIGAAFQWVWNSIIKPVADFIGNAIKVVGDTIHTVFSGIADFIGSAFQATLSVVRGPINALIDLINGVIGGLNSIKVEIPAWVPMVGGQTFGLSIPKIPRLEDGGIVTARPGGILANIGEGRYDEAVLPLSPEVLGALGGGKREGDSFTIYEAVDARATALEVQRRQHFLGAV